MLSMYALNKYSLSTYYVPGPMLGAKDKVVSSKANAGVGRGRSHGNRGRFPAPEAKHCIRGI